MIIIVSNTENVVPYSLRLIRLIIQQQSRQDIFPEERSRTGVDATSLRRIEFSSMSLRRHVPAILIC